MIVRVGAANMDKDRGGDRLYLAHLEAEVGEGVLFLVEVGRGFRSVRVRIVGAMRRWRQRWRTVGKIGAHRGVSVRRGKIGRTKVKYICFHALHVGSTSRKAQDRYYRKLRKRVRKYRRRGFEVVMGGDGNRSPRAIARYFKMTGAHTDVMGIFITEGLMFVGQPQAGRFGRLRKITGHGEIFADIAERK